MDNSGQNPRLSANPHNVVIVNVNGNRNDSSVTEPTSTSINMPAVDKPCPDWLQQMYDLEPLNWRGGEHFYDG